MTLSWLELLSVLLVPMLLGAAFLRLQGIVPRTDPLAYLGWSWLQGSLGVAVVLSAWLWLGFSLSAAWIAPVLLVLAGLGFVLGKRVAALAPSAPVRDPPWERLFFAVALGALLLSTVDRILLAGADVVAGADEGRIWAAKAKVLFHAGGFGPEFRAAMRVPEVIAHPDYPPLNPLLQLWVHAHAGEIVHVENRFPIQAFALAGILVAASALRRRARPLVAALFLVCIGTIGRLFTHQAFSDGLVALGLLACWDLWQRYQEDGELVWLRVLGCSAPLVVWSKNEGLLHVFVLALALPAAILARGVRLPERRDRWRMLAWAAPLLVSLLYLPWFNAHFGLVNDILQGGAETSEAAELRDGPGFTGLAAENAGQNVRPIVTTFARLITRGPLTRYLLLAFLVLLVVDPRSAVRGGRTLFTLGLVLALLGYMAVYLGTHWDVQEHLDHSAHRLLCHLVPAAGLWVLLYVVEALPGLSARRAETLLPARASRVASPLKASGEERFVP